MNKTTILKRTNFQKWLEDLSVYCKSEDVVVGAEYDGYTSDGSFSANGGKCKTLYYDTAKHVLLVEETESNRYVFLSGDMYSFNNIIHADSCNCISHQKPLSVFVNETVSEAGAKKIDKTELLKLLCRKFHPKVAGAYCGSLEVIAEAYFYGCFNERE